MTGLVFGLRPLPGPAPRQASAERMSAIAAKQPSVHAEELVLEELTEAGYVLTVDPEPVYDFRLQCDRIAMLETRINA